jgi:hypothetical protein
LSFFSSGFSWFDFISPDPSEGWPAVLVALDRVVEVHIRVRHGRHSAGEVHGQVAA